MDHRSMFPLCLPTLHCDIEDLNINHGSVAWDLCTFEGSAEHGSCLCSVRPELSFVWSAHRVSGGSQRVRVFVILRLCPCSRDVDTLLAVYRSACRQWYT